MKKTLIFDSAPYFSAGNLFMSRLENGGVYKIGNPHVEIIVNADTPADRKIDGYIIFGHIGLTSGNFVTVRHYRGKEYEIFGSNCKEHEHVITNATGVITHMLTCLALGVFTDKPADEPADKSTEKPDDKPTDKPADNPTKYTLNIGERIIQLPWKPQSVDIDGSKLSIKF